MRVNVIPGPGTKSIAYDDSSSETVVVADDGSRLTTADGLEYRWNGNQVLFRRPIGGGQVDTYQFYNDADESPDMRVERTLVGSGALKGTVTPS